MTDKIATKIPGKASDTCLHNSELFYQQLAAFKQFDELANHQHYQPLPEDWWVAVSDIRNSTKAIEAGQYKQINAVAAACISALINACAPIRIPYVFGGDGVSACIPSSKLDAVREALKASALMAQQQFGLELRIGLIPASFLAINNHPVLVGRYQPHPHFQQAMFSGNGLTYAEMLVKQQGSDHRIYPDPQEKVSTDVSFKGLECRWHKVPSPHSETLSLLVESRAIATTSPAATYKQVLEKIGEIYGHTSRHHPLQGKYMKLVSAPWQLTTEGRLKNIEKRIQYWGWLLRACSITWLGKLMMRFGITTGKDNEQTDWGRYPERLIANTDYRKYDDLLRMVVSGSTDQRLALQQWLELQRQGGKLYYGIHYSDSALVTCLVNDYRHDHVHFLDAADGGYAMAAKQLKQQKQHTP